MPDILFFARDPGAADAIIPLYKEYQLNSQLWLKDYATTRGQSQQCTFVDLNRQFSLARVSPVDEVLVERLLKSQGLPKVIVTGTSHFDDYTDRFLWRLAEHLRIPTIAILDHTIRVRERFVTPAGTFIPDYVLTPDQAIADMINASGLARRSARRLGLINLFETLQQRISCTLEREQIRARLFQMYPGAYSQVLLYASEPQRMLEEQGAQFSDISYDQVDIYRLIRSTLLEAGRADVLLLVKLHPKEDGSEYVTENARLIKAELTKEEILTASDLVIGTKSMLQIESLVYGKPVIAIDLWNNPAEQLFTNALGLSTRVTSRAELLKLYKDLNQLKAPRFNSVIQELGIDECWKDRFNQVLQLCLEEHSPIIS